MSAAARRAGRTLAVSAWLLPLAVLGVQALSRRWFFPQLLPGTWTFAPLRAVLTDDRTMAAVGRGLAVGVAVTAIALVAAWPAARLLATAGATGRGLIFAVLFLPSLLPAVGLAIGVNTVLLRTPLSSGLPAVVVAHLVPALPYAVALLTAAFARLDPDRERQAALLGASAWQRLRLVVLPAVAGGVAAAAVLVFLVSWSQYLLTLLAGGGRVVTVTMLLFNALAGGNPSSIGSLALVAAAPSVLALAVAAVGLREPARS
ncbi:MAG: ABC transporter permease [Acidimicrobiia bacterium]